MSPLNVLPSTLRTEIETVFQSPVEAVFPAGGGMINQAASVRLAAKTIFIKWKQHAPEGFFAAEAGGLTKLRNTATLRVPEVLHTAEGLGGLSLLVLEYIPAQPPKDAARFARRFGQELAELHRLPPPSQAGFGLEQDNYIGLLPQVNTFHQDWTDFYRECRLMPQIALARTNGLIPGGRETLLMQVVERLKTLLDNLESRPALLHGDLWSGNFLSVREEPVCFDPAVYYGEREMEIAYMELFGGFPTGILAAYREAFPLQPGYEKRRPLHQLYPLLNHLNHFGERYGADVEAACHACLQGY